MASAGVARLKEAAADSAKRKTGVDGDKKDKDDKGMLWKDKDGK
ncbi:MAG: hypothetical protein V9F04_10735 [Dermatophilaceae bacterium]